MANAKSRRALGRGLSSLIPTSSPEDEEPSKRGKEVVELDPHSVQPNPFQPRIDFDEEEIRGLADSIDTQGLLQPIVVRKKVNGYEIISGERRFRALTLLGRDTFPCIVKEKVTDREMLEMALVENIQRENLNEIEKAVSYQRLLNECGLSHDQLSKNVGKSRSAITNALRLLKLPEDIQKMVRTNVITMGHARALLALAIDSDRLVMAEKIVKEKLSVRDVERLAKAKAHQPKKTKGPKGTGHSVANVDPDIAAQAERLQYFFGTPVKIHANGDKGKIEIAYYSAEDLNRVLDIILTDAS